jgi:hypothetical protein
LACFCLLWLVPTGYGQTVNRPGELQKSCDDGNAQDCKRLGDMYRRSHLPDANAMSSALYQKALPFYQKACDGGDAKRCGDLGYLYAYDPIVHSGIPKVLQLYQKACDGGDGASCYALGNIYKDGAGGALPHIVQGVTQDDAKAMALYKKALLLLLKACDGGDAGSCGDLGEMYSGGVGVSTDVAKVVQLWKKACDGGVTAQCLHLGDFYFYGAPGILPKDEAKAVALYQKACDDWYWVGCAKVKLSEK